MKEKKKIEPNTSYMSEERATEIRETFRDLLLEMATEGRDVRYIFFADYGFYKGVGKDGELSKGNYNLTSLAGEMTYMEPFDLLEMLMEMLYTFFDNQEDMKKHNIDINITMKAALTTMLGNCEEFIALIQEKKRIRGEGE